MTTLASLIPSAETGACKQNIYKEKVPKIVTNYCGCLCFFAHMLMNPLMPSKAVVSA